MLISSLMSIWCVVVVIVRLALIRLCPEWENDKGEVLKDYEDKDMFTLSDEILENLENIDKKMSFNEIKEYLNNE